MSTFLCSLRPDPAPPGVFGWAPRDRSFTRRERGDRVGFRAVARRESGCRRSYARSGPIPLRLAYLWAPRDRSCARRERWDRLGFRAGARGGLGCRRSNARFGPIPLRLAYWWAPRDRSCARRERRDRLGFRAVARGGLGCRRSNARSGPVPLPLRGGAGRLGGGEAFGVPQRGAAYRPGVTPRVWRTTEAF